jgi:hypothetical protein
MSRSTTIVLAALLLAARPAHAWRGSEAVYLAVDAAHDLPRDLRGLVLKYRREFVAAAQDGAKSPDPDSRIAAETDAIWRGIRALRPFSETVPAMGRLAGLVAAAADPLADPRARSLPAAVAEEARRALDAAAHGPLSFGGVGAAARTGLASDLAREIAARRGARLASLEASGITPDWARDSASDALTEATNTLWLIWRRAGGDVREAKDFDERNGPYLVPGPPR